MPSSRPCRPAGAAIEALEDDVGEVAGIGPLATKMKKNRNALSGQGHGKETKLTLCKDIVKQFFFVSLRRQNVCFFENKIIIGL